MKTTLQFLNYISASFGFAILVNSFVAIVLTLMHNDGDSTSTFYNQFTSNFNQKSIIIIWITLISFIALCARHFLTHKLTKRITKLK